MQISIITSLFNRLDLTRIFLESLARTLHGWQYELILIDDASTDGTREFLVGLDTPHARVVFNETTQGFAANNNAGANLAQAPLLCFLNNDTILLPGWLEPMARLARLAPEVACVGNVQLVPGSGQINHYGVYFDGDGHPLHAGVGASRAPTGSYRRWPAVTAACWVVRKEVFLQLGGFDEQFHNGFEDTDFCLRATDAGFCHFVASRSVIYHHVSASPGRHQHEIQNRALFRRRWHARLVADHQARETARERRRDGWRYLCKHRTRPWRYNFRRVCDALNKLQSPVQSSWGLALPTRLRLRLPAGLQIPVRDVPDSTDSTDHRSSTVRPSGSPVQFPAHR